MSRERVTELVLLLVFLAVMLGGMFYIGFRDGW